MRPTAYAAFLGTHVRVKITCSSFQPGMGQKLIGNR